MKRSAMKRYPDQQFIRPIEILEQRIAPAGLRLYDGVFTEAVVESGTLLQAGTDHAGLSAGGAWMLYVEKGEAMVFTSDLNQNGKVDFNEISGVAAGNGLQMTAFADIHGDVVTNLVAARSTTETARLSDSDANAANDDVNLKGDGRVVLDSRIERIELRGLTAADIARDLNGDLKIDSNDVALRQVMATHSIFGNIFAGGGLGVANIKTTGLIIGSAPTGLSATAAAEARASIGFIKTGTAVSGEFFNFGYESAATAGESDPHFFAGYLMPFVPRSGQAGADVIGVKGVDAAGQAVPFDIDGVIAGDGGFGGRGGNIQDVMLKTGDAAGGYIIQAGDGGDGFTGGNGGSITGFADQGSRTGLVTIQAGDGGRGLTGAGGAGGLLSLANVGASGGINLSAFTVLGDVSIALGDGGDGHTAGGAGAGLKSGTLNIPTTVPASSGLNFVGSTRVAGSLGQQDGIDFDGDGCFDAVYTCTDPGAVVVLFGTATGTWDDAKTAALGYLPVTGKPQALTVADFNNDSRPDIAVASSSLGNADGVLVYLNEVIDTNGDGTLDTFNGFAEPRRSVLPTLMDHLGDSNPESGPAPGPVAIWALASGDFDNDGFMDLGMIAQYVFTGNNQGYALVMRGDSSVLDTVQITLGGVGAVDRTAGLFYADFGALGHTRTPYNTCFTDNGDLEDFLKPSALSTNFDPDNPAATVDHLFVGRQGDKSLQVLRYATGSVEVLLDSNPDAGTQAKPGLTLPRYDSNREVGPDKVSTTDVALLDFTLGDFDGSPTLPSDDFVDIAVLDQSGYLVTLSGAPNGFKTASGTGDQAGIPLTGDGGIGLPATAEPLRILSVADGTAGSPDVAVMSRFSDAGGGTRVDLINLFPRAGGGLGTGLADGEIIATATRSQAGTGQALGAPGEIGAFDFYLAMPYAEVVTLNNGAPDPGGAVETQVLFINGFSNYTLSFGGDTTVALAWDATAQEIEDALNGLAAVVAAGRVDVVDHGVRAYDLTFRVRGDQAEIVAAVTSTTASYNFGFLGETALGFLGQRVEPDDWNGIGQAAGTHAYWIDDFDMAMGHGGNGWIGKGGDGGTVGVGLGRSGTTPKFSVDITERPGTNQTVDIFAGDGGFGATGGGKGGSVLGVRLASLSGNNTGGELIAGWGGIALSGAGGNGGSVEKCRVTGFGGIDFHAGSGGMGTTGGNGGNIVGNGLGASYPDAFSAGFLAEAGDGGFGLNSGGSGGTISGLLPSLGGTGTSLAYRAGDGGNSVLGAGGAGGSVLSSSPSTIQNEITLGIFVAAGDGGDGASGGAGGRINDFVNIPVSDNEMFAPLRARFCAGNGGDGVTGVGGAGGGVSLVKTAARGFDPTGTGSVQYNLVAAGHGGDSSAGTGGAGGSVGGGRVAERLGALPRGNVDVTATRGAQVVAAGAGGMGLTQGGAGGSIGGTNANASLPTGEKVLVIAGAGGDAYGAAPVPGGDPLLVFGDINGRGGNGGGIADLKQLGSPSARVDLIAGNGGATVNYGATGDPVGKYQGGRAGGISSAALEGNAGNVNTGVAIRSYDDANFDHLADQTLRQVVDGLCNGTYSRVADDNPGGSSSILAGNVGVVVGSPGRVMNDAPATAGVTGTIAGLSARNIMSIVAGNVNRIAAVQAISGLAITVPSGDRGADKPTLGVLNYLDQSLLPLVGSVELGGALVDGAILSVGAAKLASGGDLSGARVFSF